MIRVVLDTNTLASGAIALGGTIGAMLDAWLMRRTYEVVLSLEILSELARALGRPYFTRRLEPDAIANYLATVRARATVVAITTPVPAVVRHRGDNLVLATAESAGVPYVVTGDHEMQALATYQGIAILSPRAFLDLLTP